MERIKTGLSDLYKRIKSILPRKAPGFGTGRSGTEIIKEKIKAELNSLDMITASAMAIMLSETNAKAQSPYIANLKKTDIKAALLNFLSDTYNAADIGQLERLFSKKYYKRKIRRYLRKAVVFARRGISDTLPRKNVWFPSRMRISSKQVKAYIDRICETVSIFESVKYIPALSGNKEFSASKRNYKLDHLSDSYKDALIYLVDFILTCTCISKMLFVERMIRKMPADSEFARIIGNLATSIDNHNIIINKSRPVYNQFYKAELGGIDGGDYLYGMAVTIMINKIKKTGISNPDILELDCRINTIGGLRENMAEWLDKLARDDCAKDPGALILQRITLLIKDDVSMLIDALGELLAWESFYNDRVTYYVRERDKQRYLSGDLDKEILEMPLGQ